ncbi:hypothetical protein GQ457_08G031460 [Hibiscus cannabinus]
MQIVSLGRQGSKGDRVKPLFKYGFCEYGSVNKQWGVPIFCLSGVEYRYPNRASIPKFNTGIWVSVPAREGIGTPAPTGTWVSILTFGYRYQLLENSFWAPLKSDFLHMGPHDCHICSLSSDDVFNLKSHL